MALRKRCCPMYGTAIIKLTKAHKQASIGTGLGLSIVKNIMELHHLRLVLTARQWEVISGLKMKTVRITPKNEN